LAIGRQDLEAAVAAYWKIKKDAGSVRAGKHFDPIAALIGKVFLDAGYPAEAVRMKSHLELPGYYRPTKQWDVVVAQGDTLVAAFEAKGLGSPGFGNNYNNRIEEAIGSAVDIRRAAHEGVFPVQEVWLGYFFIMEDEEKSRSPVRIGKGHFPAEQFWQGNSYQDRFNVFCERLLARGLYDAVCYVTSWEASPGPKEPVESLNWEHFSAAITRRITELWEQRGLPQQTDLLSGYRSQAEPRPPPSAS
jgi:Restriction endonuclease XhoI